jgi:uncharacterized membrane protein
MIVKNQKVLFMFLKIKFFLIVGILKVQRSVNLLMWNQNICCRPEKLEYKLTIFIVP